MGRMAALGATLAAPLVLAAFPLMAAATTAAADAREDFQTLVKDHRAAMREFGQRYAELKGKEKDERALEEFRQQWDPTPAFVEQAAEKAAEHAGTDGAVRFLVWIVENDVPTPEKPDAVPAATDKALATLATAHAASPELLGTITYAPDWVRTMKPARCVATLERLASLTKEAALKDWCQVGALRVQAEDEDLPEEKRAAAVAALADVAAASKTDGLAAEVDGYLFEKKNLQIGGVAPDIEAADLDGTNFKLSDYRGKVVVLDFWGDW